MNISESGYLFNSRMTTSVIFFNFYNRVTIKKKIQETSLITISISHFNLAHSVKIKIKLKAINL